MMKPILNLDLDGVVYPWAEMLGSYIAHIRGPYYRDPLYSEDGSSDKYQWTSFDWKLPYPEPTTWHFAHEWRMTEEELDWYFRQAVLHGDLWLYGPVIPGAHRALMELSQRYLIRIVTRRLRFPGNRGLVIDKTVQWLDREGIPYHDICFTTEFDKQNYIADAMIDDNATQMAFYKGMPADGFVLFDRPWNQNVSADVEYMHLNSKAPKQRTELTWLMAKNRLLSYAEFELSER